MRIGDTEQNEDNKSFQKMKEFCATNTYPLKENMEENPIFI